MTIRVLIALDDSEAAAAAAGAAVRLFGSDAEYWVVNVTDLPVTWPALGGFGGVGPMYVDPHLVQRLVEMQDPEDREDDVSARAEAAGVPDAKTVVREGDPVTEICRVADDLDASVIVVGSHDASTLRQLFQPAVDAGVVRASPRPVLVVSES